MQSGMEQSRWNHAWHHQGRSLFHGSELPSCEGTFGVAGVEPHYPTPKLVSAEWSEQNSASDLAAGVFHFNKWGRHYFADSCGPYPSAYAAWNFLGTTLSWTVDLSNAGCGCNLAVYTVAMRQNQREGNCGHYYCDANGGCGTHCDELDLMEANSHAFHSVAHKYSDGAGSGGGYGGSHGHPGTNYGPGTAYTINTKLPFRVHTRFDSESSLTNIQTTLEQDGRSLTFSMAPSSYLASLEASTRAGVTLVLSYWDAPSNGMR